MADTVFRFLFEGQGGQGGPSGATGPSPPPGGQGAPAPSATGAGGATAQAAGSAWGTFARGVSLAANVAQGNLIGSISGAASVAGVGGPATAIVAAFTAIVGTVKAFDAAMKKNIETLASYSPAITASQASNEVQEELQKMRRAEKYGDQLASYNDASGRLSRAWQDFKDDLLMPLADIGTGVQDAAAGILEAVHGSDKGERKGLGAMFADALPFFHELRVLRDINRDQRAQVSLARDAASRDKTKDLGAWFRDLPTIEKRVLDRAHMGIVGNRVSEAAPQMEFPA